MQNFRQKNTTVLSVVALATIGEIENIHLKASADWGSGSITTQIFRKITWPYMVSKSLSGFNDSLFSGQRNCIIRFIHMTGLVSLVSNLSNPSNGNY